jgi:hypothetical protein
MTRRKQRATQICDASFKNFLKKEEEYLQRIEAERKERMRKARALKKV